MKSCRSRPLIILDVGHNPEAVSATVDSLQGIEYRKLILVFGVMKDKDYRSMIRILGGIKAARFCGSAGDGESVIRGDHRRYFPRVELPASKSCGNVAEGIREAMRTQKKNDLLLICGSHYVAGEALQVFATVPSPKKFLTMKAFNSIF